MFDFTNRQWLRDWATIPLRMIIGFGFIAHGWAKLSKGPDGFGNILEQIGIPFPHFMGWLTTLVELFGGIALLAGAFVVVLSVPLIVINLVAMFTVHLPYGFKSIKLLGVTDSGAGQFGPPGYEVNLLYIAGIITIAMLGAGAFSIDRLIMTRKIKP